MPDRRYPVTFLVVVALAMMTAVALVAILAWSDDRAERPTIPPALTAPHL